MPIRETDRFAGDGRIRNAGEDEGLSDLLRRFAQDAGALMRQEIALAKLELQDSVKSYARDAAKIGVAGAVAFLGILALTAFAVIGLGDVLNNYWLSALIVSVALLGAAAFLGMQAIAHMRRNRIAPEESVASLKADKRWAKHEARDLKRKLKA